MRGHRGYRCVLNLAAQKTSPLCEREPHHDHRCRASMPSVLDCFTLPTQPFARESANFEGAGVACQHGSPPDKSRGQGRDGNASQARLNLLAIDFLSQPLRLVRRIPGIYSAACRRCFSAWRERSRDCARPLALLSPLSISPSVETATLLGKPLVRPVRPEEF